MEYWDLLGKEDHLESVVLQDPQEPPVLLDHLVLLENLGLLVSPVSLALLVFLENLEGLVNRVKKDLQVLLVHKADLVYLDPLGYLVFLENVVFLGFRECQD
jgi:hypothetical protein